jgi:hypothetical protein
VIIDYEVRKTKVILWSGTSQPEFLMSPKWHLGVLGDPKGRKRKVFSYTCGDAILYVTNGNVLKMF